VDKRFGHSVNGYLIVSGNQAVGQPGRKMTIPIGPS
jgi:hypothetical protein